MKLIKITDDHYVVVDDSEITTGDIVAEKLLTDKYELFTIHTLNDIDKQTQKKITHSTQPLEKFTYDNLSDEVFSMDYHNIKPLSLQEVKELIGEVDVEKRIYDTDFRGDVNSYKNGYNQALKDNKEKKYTEEDMRKVFDAARRCITMPIGGAKHQYYDEYSVSDFDEYKREILSAHTPTEWEIQIVDGKLKLV